MIAEGVPLRVPIQSSKIIGDLTADGCRGGGGVAGEAETENNCSCCSKYLNTIC